MSLASLLERKAGSDPDIQFAPRDLTQQFRSTGLQLGARGRIMRKRGTRHEERTVLIQALQVEGRNRTTRLAEEHEHAPRPQ